MVHTTSLSVVAPPNVRFQDGSVVPVIPAVVVLKCLSLKTVGLTTVPDPASNAVLTVTAVDGVQASGSSLTLHVTRSPKSTRQSGATTCRRLLVSLWNIPRTSATPMSSSMIVTSPIFPLRILMCPEVKFS